VSTFQKRSGLRALAAHNILEFSNAANSTHSIPHSYRWANLIAANAVPAVASLALVWAATIGLVVVNNFLPLNFVPLVYMLPVVVAATRWGIVSGLVAAFAGAAAADFFFYPPLYSFWLQNTQDLVDLLLYLLVAVVTSNLAARLKNEVDAVSRREKEIIELHAFSQGLATCMTSRDLIFAVQDYLSNTLKHRAILLASERSDCGPHKSDTTVPAAVRLEAARLIAAGVPRASSTIELSGNGGWLVSVFAPDILGYGAIAIELGHGSGANVSEVAKHVETVLEEAAITLTHLKVKEAIEQATINYQTETLRDALIGGVSHELRTPLASILGSCSVLGQMLAIRNNKQSRTLVEAIHDQADQLDTEIRDLLDATRITAKGVRPQPMWTDPTDIVSAAVKQKARRLASHWVTLDLTADAPLVHIDAVLVEQALGQLLENAAKYSPLGSEIKISSRYEQGRTELSVQDYGAGLTLDEKEQLGQRCFRGSRQAAVTTGSGLGLWIANTFVTANGGSLHVESPGPNLGTTITLWLPTVSEETRDLVDAVND
jgi:K+-sensing histidine kinase KdpD